MTKQRLLAYSVGIVLLLVAVTVAYTAGSISACPEEDGIDRDVLFQVSTIDALLQGAYDGSISFSDLESRGDFGIGCGDALDGEVIGLDGEWYRIRVDGRAYPISGEATTPFSSVTFFDADQTVDIDEPMTLSELEDFLMTRFPSENLFYAIRIDGVFSRVEARSVPSQEKPYPRLADAVAGQAVFSFENVTGTAIGFWTPGLAKGVNVPGYHFHFITLDRTGGGHVLAMDLIRGVVRIDTTPNFSMALPTSGEFVTADLSGDLSDDLETVEK
jgi:acetolactate decarboxylase